MKKIISLCCVLSLALGLAMSVPAAAQSTNVGEQVSYEADFSDGLPTDWKLFDGCDTSHAKDSMGTNGGVKLSHANSSINASLYHGAVYQIGTSLGSVTDFDISMQFRFLSYDNNSRWIALMYHTKVSNKKLEGYLMNIRVNGTSAQSTVTSAPSFTDTENVATGATPSDKKEHTMRVVCKDGIVEHYFDGVQVYSYSLNDKYGILGGINNEGGFAVCVNRSAIEITSLTISGTKGDDSAMKSTVDTTLAQTYMPVTKLVAAPSVIGAIDSTEKLQQLSQTETVQNAVFSVNDELQIVDAVGNVLGELDEILTKELRKRVIPVIRVCTQEQAQELTAWLRQTNILDIVVLSDDAQILQYVRRINANVRAIWDCSDRSDARLSDIVAQANESGANTVIFGDAMASTENVTYMQARLKSVWVKTSAATEVGIADLISSGACGIWAQDSTLVYRTYKNYADSNSMSRLPFNIAHRGLCLASYENTLEGCLQAYESGATHMEIDMKLTKDGHIVIMHDDNISRTTNGSGNVADMTLEQLRRYKVTKNYNGKVIGEGVNIPTLEEIFTAFEDKDVVFVLELKTSDAALVTALAKMLEQWPQMTEKIVVIAFSVDQLATMHEKLPHIPTANLNSFTYNDFANGLITSGNYYTVPDTGYGNVDDWFLANGMLTRGIMGYCWTYGSAADLAKYFASGVLGMTNNVAEKMADYVKSIDIAGESVTVGANDTVVDAIATTYGGTTQSIHAQIFLKEQRADGTYAILKYRYAPSGSDAPAYTVYSRAVKIVETNPSPSEIEAGINALPTQITLGDRAAIEQLRTAYDALSEQERALVSNSEKLVQAEEKLRALENPQPSDPTPVAPEKKDHTLTVVVAAVVAGTLACVGVIFCRRRRNAKK